MLGANLNGNSQSGIGPILHSPTFYRLFLGFFWFVFKVVAEKKKK